MEGVFLPLLVCNFVDHRPMLDKSTIPWRHQVYPTLHISGNNQVMVPIGAMFLVLQILDIRHPNLLRPHISEGRRPLVLILHILILYNLWSAHHQLFQILHPFLTPVPQLQQRAVTRHRESPGIGKLLPQARQLRAQVPHIPPAIKARYT